MSLSTSTFIAVSTPVGVGAERDRDAHRMPHRGAPELSVREYLVRDRPAGAQHGEGHEVFGEDLLLAAEAAADARREDAHPVGGRSKMPRDLVPGEERHLRAGADDEPAVLVEPADRAVRLELRVADPLRLPRDRATVTALAASAASMSPPKPSWIAAMTLRDASATRSSGVRSGCTSGAPGCGPASGSKTAGRMSYSTRMSRHASSAAAARLGDDGRHALTD